MLAILAQANGGDGADGAFLAILLMGVCGFYIALLLIGIFFLLTLHKALAKCHPRNRTMEPGMVWLNLIPLFNLVWQFITVVKVAESLEYEYRDRGWHRRGEDYGKGLGITTCALGFGGIIPYCGILIVLAGLVCSIVYWVKIAGYSRDLSTGSTRYDDYDDDEDDHYDDDRRPRRRRRERDDDERDDKRNERKDRDERDDDGDKRDERRPWERR